MEEDLEPDVTKGWPQHAKQTNDGAAHKPEALPHSACG
jgi:hypothetical protein